MINPKVRMLWMQWHAYLACFFLPIALLYAITGALYLLDIKGGFTDIQEFSVSVPQGWPAEQASAETLIKPILTTNQQPPLPEDYFTRGGNQNWYGFSHQITLSPTDNPQQRLLEVKTRDLWQKMVLIHKGHAGIIFWAIGILLGISLIFSLLSGVILALNIPRFKKSATLAMGLGLVSVVVALMVS